MKIKEAIEIINGSTSTVLVKESDDFLRIYHRDLNTYNNWFLKMHIDATNWDSICSDWDCLSNIEPQDLARVMDVIQRLLDTPINERFPESKYTVQVLADYDESFLNVGKDDGFAFFKDEVEAGSVQTQFTQAEIDELKQRDDLAIDWNKATIKEVKDDED